MAERPAAPPPLVTVVAILFYVGGGLAIVYALIDFDSAGAVTGMLPVWGEALYGAVFVGLARALQLGLRWARLVALAVGWFGLALAVLYLIEGSPRAAAEQGAWSAIYLVMLTRSSVRAWFAPTLAPTDASPQPPEHRDAKANEGSRSDSGHYQTRHSIVDSGKNLVVLLEV